MALASSSARGCWAASERGKIEGFDVPPRRESSSRRVTSPSSSRRRTDTRDPRCGRPLQRGLSRLPPGPDRRCKGSSGAWGGRRRVRRDQGASRWTTLIAPAGSCSSSAPARRCREGIRSDRGRVARSPRLARPRVRAAGAQGGHRVLALRWTCWTSCRASSACTPRRRDQLLGCGKNPQACPRARGFRQAVFSTLDRRHPFKGVFHDIPFRFVIPARTRERLEHLLQGRHDPARARRADCASSRSCSRPTRVASTRQAPPSQPLDHAAGHNTALPLDSFAGIVPRTPRRSPKRTRHITRRCARARRRRCEGHITLKDIVVQVAPGVSYNTSGFRRPSRPRPVVHVRQGQTVDIGAGERRRHPAFDRLPRCAHRPEQRVPRRRSGSRSHSASRRQTQRLHVPLRYEAGASAHRQRECTAPSSSIERGAPPGRSPVRARR